MDGRDSLCKILKALLEIAKPLKQELLIDYMMGRESSLLIKRGYDNLETFASGDNRDEEHWTEVIERGINEGYMKNKADGVGIMAKGKKYLKKPVEFELKGEDEGEDFERDENSASLSKMVEDVIIDGSMASSRAVSTQRKLAIIQAIDRRIALDDFASNQGLDFDEVLSDVESLLASGRHLDLTYFAEEVLGTECIDELCDYYDTASSDSLDKALDEYGDVYREEELRLARVIWRSRK